MRLIIAGGRDFYDYDLLANSVWEVYERFNHDCECYALTICEIVSGAAKGADTLGERFAKQYSVKLTQFPADWDTHGNAAGLIRNKQMGDYADELLAFWDGKSTGTKHMIDYMTSLGKPVWIRTYKPKTKKARPKK